MYKAVKTTNYCESYSQTSCNENKKESFWNISKKSIHTVSSSKQKQASETLISSQDLSYPLYFKGQ